MAEILAQVQVLENLDQRYHWFCNRIDDAKPGVHNELPQLPSVETPRLLIQGCYRIFAYETDEISSQKEFLVNGINKQLGKCDACIKEYYTTKKEFLDKLREQYDDDDVELLAGMFHQHDIERILRGLADCTTVLKGLGKEQRVGSAVPKPALRALNEALTNERFLIDDALVREHLLQPLELLQTMGPYKIGYCVPAMSQLLASDVEVLRHWAVHNVESLEGTIQQDDFDFAFRCGLKRHLQKGSIYPIDSQFLAHLWRALKLIVRCLDRNLITHSLRALDISVYRLALDHLQFPSSGMRYIIQTLLLLLRIGPKDFWDAMGAIAPSTVAEQIFRSPQFMNVLQASQDGDVDTETSALMDILSWPKPLLKSLQVGQRPPFCRTIVSQVIHKIPSGSLTAATKEACLNVGLDCLSLTIESCVTDLNTFDATSHAVVVDALDLTWECAKEMLDIIDTSAIRNPELQSRCSLILKGSLKLECKALQIARQILQTRSQGFKLSTPRLWKMIESRLRRGSTVLTLALLGAMGSVDGLSRLDALGTAESVKEFNIVVDEIFVCIGRTLDKVGAFPSSELALVTKDDDSIRSISTLLPFPEPSINGSALEAVKSITSEPYRKEALRYFLTYSLHAALDGLSASAHSVARDKSFEPCPLLLKLYSDIIDALCDPQGLLRQSVFSLPSDVRAIAAFWENAWAVLAMMYESCEVWSRKRVAASAVLREFVRDVMQLSEMLFDQFAVFNTAMKSSQGEFSSTGGEEAEKVTHKTDDATRKLLEAPSQAMDDMVKFLRLRDEYLLRTSAELVSKLLGTLTKEGMVLPLSSSEYLAQIAIYDDQSERIGTRTLLTPTEIAGITRDLEENLGRPIVDETRALAMMGKGLPEAKIPAGRGKDDAITTSLSLQQRPKKQGTIDIGTWTQQADSLKSTEKYRSKDNGVTKSIKDSKEIQDIKTRAMPSSIDRRGTLKAAQTRKTAAQQESFLAERKRQKQEAEARKAEQLAKIKRNIPNLIAGQTSGEGSAIAKIGMAGKDHAPKGESMMVSSESDSDSDDEIDKELFGSFPRSETSAAVANFNATRAKQMKAQMPVKKTRIVRSAKDMRARLAPQMTGLWSRLLAWDFFYEGGFPPDSATHDYNVVAATFRTAQEYRKSFEALLLLEAWSSFQKSREEGNSRAMEVKVSSRITVDSLFEVTIVTEPAQVKSMGIFEADIILLSKSIKATEDANAPHCLGRIHRIRHKRGISEVTVRIAHAPLVQSVLSPNAPTYAARIDSVVTLEREYGALAGLEWYDLCQEIIEAQISPILKYSNEKLERLANIYKLNQAQAKAVQSAMDNDAFTLIQGPPGSGKTKTITAIVGALLTDTIRIGAAVAINAPGDSTRIQHGNTAGAKKLLVCAPSNAAVDELVMRFMDGVKGSNGMFYKPKVVRLGRSDKVNPQVLSVTLDELVDKIVNPVGGKAPKEATGLEKAIEAHKTLDKQIKEMYVLFEEATAAGGVTDHETTKKFERLKRERQGWSSEIERHRDGSNTATRDADIRKRQVEQKVLNDAHIICATLSGSARESFQHLTIDFETVVIDEAAQCIELSALIPLKYGCSKCIMVGDPKQLPPTVLSREAARFQYEQSLFVRMQRNQPQDVHLLDTQYRMHPAISQYPSKAFYEGKLLDGPNMVELRTKPWHQDKLLGPYQFYDVAGRHETAIKGHSLINKFEVEIAIQLYKRLTSSVRGYDFNGKIGIITPYKSQLRLLSERFVAAFGPDIQKTIEFNTTDAFQGRESEIIIFSCVRASDRGIGFLSDIRRMNVGITRAKSSLWVLGSSQALMQGEYWRGLIQDAQTRGYYSTGDVLRLLKETPRLHVTGQLLPVVQRRVSTPENETDVTALPRSNSTWESAVTDHGPSQSLVSQDPRKNRPMPTADDLAKSETPSSVVSQGDQDSLQHQRSAHAERPPATERTSKVSKIPARRDTADGMVGSGPPKQPGVASEPTSREDSSTELKRKRSKSPPLQFAVAARPPPPRKIRRDDAAAFVKPRRKR